MFSRVTLLLPYDSHFFYLNALMLSNIQPHSLSEKSSYKHALALKKPNFKSL